jgi:hypothetical protein
MRLHYVRTDLEPIGDELFRQPVGNLLEDLEFRVGQCWFLIDADTPSRTTNRPVFEKWPSLAMPYLCLARMFQGGFANFAPYAATTYNFANDDRVPLLFIARDWPGSRFGLGDRLRACSVGEVRLVPTGEGAKAAVFPVLRFDLNPDFGPCMVGFREECLSTGWFCDPT